MERHVLFAAVFFFFWCDNPSLAFIIRPILLVSTITHDSRNNIIISGKAADHYCSKQDNDDDDDVLENEQVKAGRIVSSFEPNEFRPFITNCHIQTIVGALFRDKFSFCRYVVFPNERRRTASITTTTTNTRTRTTDPDYFWEHRERIETNDGDWFHADSISQDVGEGDGHVIILHGLESNSNSSLTIDMARSFLNRGMKKITCLNFRGCSGEPNDTLGGYHLGFTDDLRQYLELQVLQQQQQREEQEPPTTKLYLAGFSLGANAVLKCLGELGTDAIHRYNIRGGMALCVPLDATVNAPFLGKPGFNQIVYCQNLLRTLKTRAHYQLERFCDNDVTTTKFDYEACMNAKTITEFDDAFVAPVYGYKDAYDYYQQTSSIYYLDTIAVPTLVLNSKDDPFMDPGFCPIEKTRESGDGKAPIQMVYTKHGGHLGYLFHRPNRGEVIPDTSWASTELGRFLHHIHTQQHTTPEEEK